MKKYLQREDLEFPEGIPQKLADARNVVPSCLLIFVLTDKRHRRTPENAGEGGL